MTETSQFCTRCGGGLEDGVCPRHERVQAPPPRRLVRRAGVAAMAVVAAVALLATPLIMDRRARARAEHRVDRQFATAAAELKGLAGRVQQLEGRLETQSDPVAVAKKVGPSVVTIETAAGIGSGFAMSSSTDRTAIVTNLHVVEDAWKTKSKEVKVRQPGHDFTGTIESVNAAQDLALVRIREPLPALVRAPGNPAVGDPVIVVGSPFGLENTVSTGIVSALRDGFVQFSAPSSPGNSGGPVVDRAGRVLGVTQKKAVGDGAEGLSFAIPIAVVCATLATC